MCEDYDFRDRDLNWGGGFVGWFWADFTGPTRQLAAQKINVF